MMKDQAEIKKMLERSAHYIGLGFLASELDDQLLFDDELWEQAKGLQENPDLPGAKFQAWLNSLTREEKKFLKEDLRRKLGR